jgi:hypothetical protein
MGLMVKIKGKDEWHYGTMTPEDEPVFYWMNDDGTYRKMPSPLIRQYSESDKIMNAAKKEIENDKKPTKR